MTKSIVISGPPAVGKTTVAKGLAEEFSLTYLSGGDVLKEMAKEHLHLTAKQAGEIAKKSNSKKLILTHISQRYEKEKNKLFDEAKKIFKNVVLAEDFDSFEI